MTMKAPKRLSSGKYVDLANLSVDDIDIDDIDRSLNYIYRFTGHFKDAVPLTVAQHTLLVYEISKEVFPDDKAVHFDCILHDFPECYYSDLVTPLKGLLGNAYREFASGIDSVVYEKLWKLDEPFTEDVYIRRKICDGLALDIERRTMWDSPRGKNLWPEKPSGLDALTTSDKRDWFHRIQSKRFVDLVELYERF